jgi:ribonuclease P protein component
LTDDVKAAQAVDCASNERLPSWQRIKRRADFLSAQRRGGRATSECLVVYVTRNDLGYARLGLTTSRKVGNAVVRNRWRRLLREAFRLHKAELPRAHDIVVIVKAHGEAPSLDTLTREFILAATRACESRGGHKGSSKSSKKRESVEHVPPRPDSST